MDQEILRRCMNKRGRRGKNGSHFSQESSEKLDISKHEGILLAESLKVGLLGEKQFF